MSFCCVLGCSCIILHQATGCTCDFNSYKCFRVSYVNIYMWVILHIYNAQFSYQQMCICVYVCMYVYVCACVCVCVCVYVCIHTCIHTHIHVCVCVYSYNGCNVYKTSDCEIPPQTCIREALKQHLIVHATANKHHYMDLPAQAG